MIKARINEIEVEVPAGTSILDAARHVQVKIPTLCKHRDLLPTAACGICVVRNKGGNKLIRACCTPLEEGMQDHCGALTLPAECSVATQKAPPNSGAYIPHVILGCGT